MDTPRVAPITPPIRTPLWLVTEALEALEAAQKDINKHVHDNVCRGGAGEPCELNWVSHTANARLKLDYAIRRLRAAREGLSNES